MPGQAVRRVEFLMAMAYAADLAIGQPRDFALRSCVLAMRIAAAAGLNTAQQSDVFHQALLRYIGCNADTYLMSALFGDEIAFRQDFARIDAGRPAEIAGVIARAMRRGAAARPGLQGAFAVVRGLALGKSISVPILAGHCEVAERIGARLGLGSEICGNLAQLYERWDGKGLPKGLKGEAVALAVRVVTLAQDALVLSEAHGFDIMRSMVAKRRGSVYDPALADLFLERPSEYMQGVEGPVERMEILELEPAPKAFLDQAALDEAFSALADMADMRMPFTLGHSRAVSALGEAAGRRLGLPQADITALRRAGLAHDIGELAVPVDTWMRTGPLSAHETDASHLHPYHGERILAGLADSSVAALVSRHHERLDGSGYHRGIRGPDLSAAARILAAAEMFQTAREPRPHRTALSEAAAAARLRAGVRAGELDGEAAEAVLGAAGQATRRAAGAERLAGLTSREIEVLRQITLGKTAKEAARALGIAPKTASNHIQSVYAKIGVGTRGGAVLYALERGLFQQYSGET